MPDLPPESFALDSPLDVPDWDRRAPVQRRVDDRTFRERCTAIAGDVGKMVIVCSAVIGALSWLGTMVGFRLYGPTQQMAAMAVRQDSAEAASVRLGVRVGRLEDGARETRTTLQLQSYLLCTQRRPNDPVALDGCRKIIEEMQHPSGSP